MFDDELEGASGDRHALADLAAGVEQDARIAGCRKLVSPFDTSTQSARGWITDA